MADDNILDAKEWTAFEEADLEVAVHLTKTFRPKPLEIICFHCQQASEKAVKMAKEFVEWAKSVVADAEAAN